MGRRKLFLQFLILLIAWVVFGHRHDSCGSFGISGGDGSNDFAQGGLQIRDLLPVMIGCQAEGSHLLAGRFQLPGEFFKCVGEFFRLFEPGLEV